MTLPVTIRKVEPDDLSALLLFSEKTFFDAFYHLNNPCDMRAYASRFFTEEQMIAEMSNPLSHFYFALINNEITGYIKLNFGAAQSDVRDDQSLEIERIYVSKYHQGKQIGKTLLDFSIQTAIDNKLQYIWLGVWEQNDRAIKFYNDYGFTQFGQHDFMLGDDLQVDLLLKLPMATLLKRT